MNKDISVFIQFIDYTTKKVSEVTGITFRQEQHSQKDFASIKKEISSINLKIYSDDINNIDNCIQELDRALEEEYTDYTLKDYIDLIKSLTKAEVSNYIKLCIIISPLADWSILYLACQLFYHEKGFFSTTSDVNTIIANTCVD